MLRIQRFWLDSGYTLPCQFTELFLMFTHFLGEGGLSHSMFGTKLDHGVLAVISGTLLTHKTVVLTASCGARHRLWYGPLVVRSLLGCVPTATCGSWLDLGVLPVVYGTVSGLVAGWRRIRDAAAHHGFWLQWQDEGQRLRCAQRGATCSQVARVIVTLPSVCPSRVHA